MQRPPIRRRILGTRGSSRSSLQLMEYVSAHQRRAQTSFTIRYTRCDNYYVIRAAALFLISCALFAAEHRSASLTVSVRPQVVLSIEGSSNIKVKIRLSPSSSAHLWIADTCTAPASAPFVLAQSGEYHIPVSALNGTGGLVCVTAVLDGLGTEARLPFQSGVPTIQSSPQAQTFSTI